MIDLHTHSTCSDGTDSPRALVNKAIIEGVKIMALTDHDTTSGWQEAIAALRPAMQLVLGAEISTLTNDGISVHILGLLFDGEDKAMVAMLEEIRDERLPRMRKMVSLMRAEGFDISMDDVVKAQPIGATLGRPHLADALVAKGIVTSRDQAFAELLNNESRFYVAHAAPLPEEAIAMIGRAGGVSVIAHANASFRGKAFTAQDFAGWLAAGLNGIEVDHRDHNPQERKTLREIANELGLAITGSSDYHGTGKLNSLGENRTHPAEWERLESAANDRRVVSA